MMFLGVLPPGWSASPLSRFSGWVGHRPSTQAGSVREIDTWSYSVFMKGEKFDTREFLNFPGRLHVFTSCTGFSFVSRGRVSCLTGNVVDLWVNHSELKYHRRL